MQAAHSIADKIRGSLQQTFQVERGHTGMGSAAGQRGKRGMATFFITSISEQKICQQKAQATRKTGKYRDELTVNSIKKCTNCSR